LETLSKLARWTWNKIASSIIGGKWLLTGVGDAEDGYEDGIFTPGPQMPFDKEYHCQITVNSTHVIVVDDGKGALMVNWPT